MPSIPALPQGPCLGVIMPVFNERETIKQIIGQVLDRKEVMELLIIDDCSTDGTREILEELQSTDVRIRLLCHAANQGKGAAIRTGIRELKAPAAIIQDADLEYNPEDYSSLLAPLHQGKADAVFGSRFIGGQAHRVLYFWHMIGNKILTLASNMFTNLNLTDMECCYKVFLTPYLKGFRLTEDGFGIEPELAAKAARQGLRIYEVGVSYSGRTYAEGKKITWRDGLRALWAIVKS